MDTHASPAQVSVTVERLAGHGRIFHGSQKVLETDYNLTLAPPSLRSVTFEPGNQLKVSPDITGRLMARSSRPNHFTAYTPWSWRTAAPSPFMSFNLIRTRSWVFPSCGTSLGREGWEFPSAKTTAPGGSVSYALAARATGARGPNGQQ
jgi:hypothetical protein